jgi:hypothetical protein
MDQPEVQHIKTENHALWGRWYLQICSTADWSRQKCSVVIYFCDILGEDTTQGLWDLHLVPLSYWHEFLSKVTVVPTKELTERHLVDQEWFKEEFMLLPLSNQCAQILPWTLGEVLVKTIIRVVEEYFTQTLTLREG